MGALAEGAAAAVKDVGGLAVKQACKGLKRSIADYFGSATIAICS